MTYDEAKQGYKDIFHFTKEADHLAALRELAKTDLFFFLVYILNREDADHPWIYDRCREFQANPNGHLDLWAREHYKSTIITFAATIQEILNNQEGTYCILSFTGGIARAFAKQIKRELETNIKLIQLFPDVLYTNPAKESPKWTENEGIIVKRKGNPKEATLEAWGLVDNQPTSKHYTGIVYDDTVTKDTVSNPEMVAKTVEAWELSDNLRAKGGWVRYIGTRYHFNDPYKVMMERGIIPRIHAATNNGSMEGKPVLLTMAQLQEKRRIQGVYTFNCQMLQNPVRDNVQGFNEAWLRYWPAIQYNNLNKYIICDPASSKKDYADYTAMWCIGVGPDKNYYILDVVRDRLNLTERCNLLMTWHQAYKPIGVGYEKYGLQSDIEHYEYVMNQRNYRFGITELGGKTAKPERIKKLVPIFEAGRIFLPETKVKVNYENVQEDLIALFIKNEYKAFPYPYHDDMLDCMARMLDPELMVTFPQDTIGEALIPGMARQYIDDKDDYQPMARKL